MASTSALPPSALPHVPTGARVLSGGMENVPALEGANFWDPASGPKAEVVALVGTDAFERYHVRQALQGSGLVIHSRGAEPQRVLLVWREADVADSLAAVLPRAVVQDAILPRLRELLEADAALARARYAEVMPPNWPPDVSLPPDVPVGARVLSGGTTHVPALRKAATWRPASGPSVEVCALVDTDGYQRYHVRQSLHGSGLLVHSRGAEPHRVLLVWREADVADALAAALPLQVVQQGILPRLRQLLAAEDAAAYVQYVEKRGRRSRRWVPRPECRIRAELRF